MSEPNGQALFNVHAAKAVTDRLKDIILSSQNGKKVIACLKNIYARLRRDPDVFGEALFTYQQSNLQMRLGAIAPLAVRYAVDLQHRRVVIQGFSEMLGSVI